MELSHEFLTDSRTFTSYEDFKDSFELNIPDNFNFSYDIVDRYASECPEKVALVWCNDEGEKKVFTFAQISSASKKTANFLTAHGIKKGDVVMLMLRRQFEYWYFILALHRIGAIAVPAAEQLLSNDIEYRIETAGVKMIVVGKNESLVQEVRKANKKKIDVVGVGVGSKNFFSENIDFYSEFNFYTEDFPRPQGQKSTCNTDPMLIFFTSGTSAYPKMVVHDYLYPIGHIVTAKYWQCVQDDGIHFTMAEMGWAKASWGKIYGQWICGSAVFAYDRKKFSPHQVLSNIEKNHITTFCAPPTIIRYLLREKNVKKVFSNVSHVCTAGEALSCELAQKFTQITGKKLYEGYGQTETTLLTANFTGMEIKIGSMGKASPEYCIDVIDNNGKSCKNGEVGELVINLKKQKTVGLFTGYYNNLAENEKVFSGGIYHTGDDVYRDEDGYFWFIGRNDDIIKSAGFRISPFEVENILLKHDSVFECAVTGEKDFQRGQIVKAWIVLKKDYKPSKKLEEDLIDFIKSQTSLFKVPRTIEFVETLPKTYNGKIKRAELRSKNKE